VAWICDRTRQEYRRGAGGECTHLGILEDTRRLQAPTAPRFYFAMLTSPFVGMLYGRPSTWNLKLLVEIVL
jgi:hypothetical protein